MLWAPWAVRALLEMAADDYATRFHSPRVLVLQSPSDSADPSSVPTCAFGASSGSVTNRVKRLIDPHRKSSLVAVTAGVGGCCAGDRARCNHGSGLIVPEMPGGSGMGRVPFDAHHALSQWEVTPFALLGRAPGPVITTGAWYVRSQWMLSIQGSRWSRKPGTFVHRRSGRHRYRTPVAGGGVHHELFPGPCGPASPVDGHRPSPPRHGSSVDVGPADLESEHDGATPPRSSTRDRSRT